MSASHRRSARATSTRLAAGGGRAGRSSPRVRRAAAPGGSGRPAGPASRGGRRPRLTRRARAVAPDRGSAGPGRGGPQGQRRPGLTTRAAVLALVVCGVVLGLAYPFRTHLAQRAELDRLVAEAEERTARVASLEADIARWDDPAHVESEARRRLGYVHPGETLYTVLDPSPPAEVEEASPPPGVPPLRQQAPWWGQLWHSAQGSDAEPVTPAAPTR